MSLLNLSNVSVKHRPSGRSYKEPFNKDQSFLIPSTEFPQTEKALIQLADKKVSIKFNIKDKTFLCPLEREIKCMTVFWFAIKVFYPNSEVYKKKK